MINSFVINVSREVGTGDKKTVEHATIIVENQTGINQIIAEAGVNHNGDIKFSCYIF